MVALRVITVFCAVTLVGCATGCFAPYQPDFDRVPWKSVRVHYCVGSESPVEWQSWFTEDRSVLAELQNALKVTYVGDLWGLVTYEYNEVDIVLENGNRWSLHFFTPTKLSSLRQPSPETSFSLDVDQAFFEKLRSLVSTSTTNDVHFFYSSPVTVLRK